MTDNLLFVGIDGFDLTLADYYEHPFWEMIRGEGLTIEIPKPGDIEGGQIATASSPRLWGRIYTGCPPEENGILGFWEKIDPETGDVLKVEVDQDWVMDNRCEKTVMADDFLVPTLWEIALDNGLGVGSSGTWFTYPIQDHVKERIDENGGWMLSDAPFPFDHDQFMDRDRIAHPPAVFPDDWPKDEEYLEEVGAGMRTPKLAREDPWGFYTDLLKADEHRYCHLGRCLDAHGEQPLTMTLTRGTDAIAHKFRLHEDIQDHYPEQLQDPEGNFRRVVTDNFDRVQEIWKNYDFDHLVLGGDHGCGSRSENGELIFEGDDHEWPATMSILSPDIEGGQKIRAKYEDITPTILDLLDVTQPEHIQGSSLVGQARVESRLRDLGYAP